jgi:hypothetical protein
VNERMKSYKILWDYRDYEDLEQEVNNHLAQGYVLIGGLCVVPETESCRRILMQAVALPNRGEPLI